MSGVFFDYEMKGLASKRFKLFDIKSFRTKETTKAATLAAFVVFSN